MWLKLTLFTFWCSSDVELHLLIHTFILVVLSKRITKKKWWGTQRKSLATHISLSWRSVSQACTNTNAKPTFCITLTTSGAAGTWDTTIYVVRAITVPFCTTAMPPNPTLKKSKTGTCGKHLASSSVWRENVYFVKCLIISPDHLVVFGSTDRHMLDLGDGGALANSGEGGRCIAFQT